MRKKTTRHEQENGGKRTVRDSVAGVPPTTDVPPGDMPSSPARQSAATGAQAGITRATERDETPEQSGNPITRAARSVRRAISRLTHRGHDAEMPIATVPEHGPEKPARLARLETDIPMDEITSAYTPSQTSLKSSFRSDGRDRQSDQEYATGAADTRWNDEDRITNKSGDPRIGTHGRTYEAGERSSAPVDNE